MGYDDPNNALAAQVGLKDYDALLDISSLQKQQTSTLVTTAMPKLKHGWKIARLSFH